MKKHQKEDRIRRRDFIRQSACASLGVTGLVNALAQMRLLSAAAAQTPPTSDYKALVCLFLNGGHDSNNFLVPRGTASAGSLRADYANGRGVLALPSVDLNALALPAGTKAFNRHHAGTVGQLGLHPAATDLASLFSQKKLAVISNVGTLAYPVSSRAEYDSGNIPLPPQLFSHSDQQTQWQSSVPDQAFSSGWGGRAADLLHSSYNSGTSKVSMSISLAGVNSFQVGTSGQVTQYSINDEGTVPFSGYGENYTDALNTNGTYKTTPAGVRFKAFEDIIRLTHANLHEEEYKRVVVRSRAAEGSVGVAITAAAATGVDFDTLFANTTTRLGSQLKMIAKLIAGRNVLGNNRQIFFCQIGGFDTHQTLLASHGDLITELNNSLAAFSATLQALGVWDNVTTFTASDFNRTFTPNNTDPAKAGSDHAWGSHAIVLGGAVNGGDIFGHFPSLKVGNTSGSIDAGSANRGRWIPTTSVDQYSSVLARWFGASSSEIEAIFPNLPRFDAPSSSSSNLAFL